MIFTFTSWAFFFLDRQDTIVMTTFKTLILLSSPFFELSETI